MDHATHEAHATQAAATHGFIEEGLPQPSHQMKQNFSTSSFSGWDITSDNRILCRRTLTRRFHELVRLRLVLSDTLSPSPRNRLSNALPTTFPGGCRHRVNSVSAAKALAWLSDTPNGIIAKESKLSLNMLYLGFLPS